MSTFLDALANLGPVILAAIGVWCVLSILSVYAWASLRAEEKRRRVQTVRAAMHEDMHFQVWEQEVSS